MATNTSDFYSYSKSSGTAKNLQKPTVAGDTNVWGTSLNTDLDSIVAAVNAMSDLIADASQNELIDFTATGSAVNHIGITNAATGNAPSIAAIGDNTNINLTLAPKGSGEVDISKVDIDGGAIDGTVIGASSQAAGDFTAIGAVAAGTVVGTTIDATTDFTIGGMVLTDGQIADTGTLALVPVDGLTISLGVDSVMTIESTGNIIFHNPTSGQASMQTARSANSVAPSDNNGLDLGSSSYKWANIWVTSVNEGSSREIKNTITDCQLGEDFINQLRPVRFRRNEGNTFQDAGKRYHFGLIAQEIEDMLAKNSIDLNDFAPLCKEQITDKNGIEPGENGYIATDDYTLRYSQFTPLIIKAVQELSAKVTALEAN